MLPILGAGLGASAGATGIGNAIGGLMSGIGSIFGIGRGRRQNKRNVRNMRLQHDLDKQMFDYQNAYNTPAKQMERLKAAGLNPALMYGQGTTGNASGYPQTKPLPAYQETPVDTQSVVAGMTAMQNLKFNRQLTKEKELDNVIKTQTIEDAIKAPGIQNRKTEAEVNKLGKDIDNLNQLILESKSKTAKAWAERTLTNEMKRKVKQEITNLKTLDDWNDLKKRMDVLKKGRMDKGIHPGDIFGNILKILEKDPSIPEDRAFLQTLIYGYFGVQTGERILRMLPGMNNRRM